FHNYFSILQVLETRVLLSSQLKNFYFCTFFTGYRVEDFLFEKIDKKRPNRLSNLEYLGLDMIEAGNEFGPGTAYGSALIKVGQNEQRLGHIERDFIASSHHCFLVPLRKFLDGEMKTILKERSILESKRLDLDACKNRVRKARSMLGQPTVSG
ncbi:endophilin-B1-like, partial [Homalodisca vitripennis]|uniref:endophilin-B1-like n=1 Tax=Homalodisca vitripennis TaxID=197043 RepID=UPI001EEB9706